MTFWVVMGVIVGAILGGMGGGAVGAVAVGALGAGIGALIARSIASSAKVTEPPPAPRYGEAASAPARSIEPPAQSSPPDSALPPATAAEILRRLDALDARLARIEARLGGDKLPEPSRAAATPGMSIDALPVVPATPPPRHEEAPVIAAPLPPATPAATPALDVPAAGDMALARAPDGTLQPVAAAVASSRVDTAADAAGAADEPPPRPDYGAPREATRSEPSWLWRWITGGNALTRVGIVILFFGVAFLLTYFAEIVTVPIELKLAAAGAGGVLLAALGVVLARRRPAYGLSLQGAGMGIVYLVVFAAFRLYDVLPPAIAIALLVVVAATTIALALRHDSQPLAALALAGGFLAPVLIRTDATNPALLFGYFAILNAVVFALAWRRAWRPLNVLGFVFTFALGLVWGYRFYAPAHYATVQPFLALFFLFYVTIAVLYAKREPLDHRAPVDGLLVFGVPIVGFALQMGIARGYRYGVAWSAGALAAFYGVLWFVLRRRAEAGLALLARAFGVLAVAFGTLAIPFAADPRATSAWWAIEAAAVYWIGAVQRQRIARLFALALQLAAAIAFALDAPEGGERWFLNASFLGPALIGVAALASAWIADRHRGALGDREAALVPWLFMWGAAWWLFGGIDELRRQLAPEWWGNAALAWIVASSGIALSASAWLRWPRAGWIGVLLLPTIVIVGLRLVQVERTTLTHFGWIVWPCAFVAQWAVLRFQDAAWADDATLRVRSDFARLSHTVSAIALVAWLSWEASEWAGRYTDRASVWIACAAALPSILYLLAATRWRDAKRWPFDRHGDAYGSAAGTTLAALLVAWFAIVNVVSPGDPAPLPFVPIANPLDLSLATALVALARWSRAWARVGERTRWAALGAGAFLALNGTVVRAAHHWGDVPWRFAALAEYKPLQAALTLTWTATALALMLWATRKGVRGAWMAGAALLAAVVVKLFAIDLAALSGLTRVVAFMGVGALLLVIGYVAPLPPSVPQDERGSSDIPG